MSHCWPTKQGPCELSELLEVFKPSTPTPQPEPVDLIPPSLVFAALDRKIGAALVREFRNDALADPPRFTDAKLRELLKDRFPPESIPPVATVWPPAPV